MTKSKYLVNFVVSCIQRFPFWEALSLMMLFGEIESKQNQKISFPLQLVYVDSGILVLLGTFMSFNSHWKRPCAVMAALQMAVHCFIQFAFHKMKHEVALHILLRNIGVIGSYFLIAAGIGEDRKAKRSGMLQLSLFCFGILLSLQAFHLATSDFEQRILKHLIMRPAMSKLIVFLIPLLTFCLGVSSYCFLTQNSWLQQAKYFVVLFMLCIFVPSDLFAFRWKNKLEFWTCLRLIASSFMTLSGVTVLSLK